MTGSMRLSGLLAVCLLLAFPVLAMAKDIHTEVLDNGLTVVLKEEHKAPVASFQVWYNIGSRHEVGGKTGLSHLLEHMMFKGTQTHGKGEYSRIVAKYGGNENAFTSRDYTAYFMNWSPEHLQRSVALEADRMTGLLLDAEQFDLEREVVREERRMRIDDNPVYATVEQLYAAAFIAHPYRQPVIGWMSDLESLTRDDAYRHYKRYYAPDNATVVVVGDFNTKTMLASIKRVMGKLPSVGVQHDPLTVEPVQSGERRVTLRREAQLPFVMLGYHVPNWQSEDALALEVLAQVLFDGKRSRMYQRLTYTDQSAVDAGGDYDPLSADQQFFYFHAMVAEGHTVDEVENAIQEEVERLRIEPPTEREVQRAKNQIEADYLFAQDSVFYQAMRLGEAVTVGAGIDYVEQFPERVRQVTAADVTRVAQRYLTPNGRTVAVLLPEAPVEGGEGSP